MKPNFLQNSPEGRVLAFIERNNLVQKEDRVIVAVSGGPDSVALLKILLTLKDTLQCQILACHFNHRLRGEESDKDEAFVGNLCREWGVPCFFGSAVKEKLYKNENEAREARYAFFEKLLQEGRGDKVATAHHQNDLAETVLLRMVRGSGLAGLKSIPSRRGKFIRPLLALPRSEILKYLKEKEIDFRTDKTNYDLKFTRNRIRHELLPILAGYNPNIVEMLAGVAGTIEKDYQFIEDEVSRRVAFAKEENEIKFSYKSWRELPDSLKFYALRLAISELDSLEGITLKQLTESVEMLEKGHGKKMKILPHSLRVTLLSGTIIVSKNRKEVSHG